MRDKIKKQNKKKKKNFKLKNWNTILFKYLVIINWKNYLSRLVVLVLFCCFALILLWKYYLLNFLKVSFESMSYLHISSFKSSNVSLFILINNCWGCWTWRHSRTRTHRERFYFIWNKLKKFHYIPIYNENILLYDMVYLLFSNDVQRSQPNKLFR